ncbi:TonB-dependent receptor plug domain-containing protein, partial [Phenylobacterium sp.]|uniref:TonB-dependent receptor plug domain-containing protein n=1 Tax=Phenylobacterium sp. TaxID=1871053 RepID=UPI002E3618B7
MRYGLALFAAASAATLLTSGASAQARQEAEVEELVVTGTRTEGRSRLDTLAPVDVVSAEALSRTGTTELAQSLSTVTPSINFPRPAITDGTDHVRPATLRGLAPDQTLVLVNSTRRHASALVNVNGSVGRGSAAVDLNAIPTVALETIEVLREGASAQYGSDAIAGVINLRLREAREGGGLSVTYGQYATTVKTPRNTGGRDENDGQTVTVQGWTGLPLGPEGFVTLSGEYLQRDPTSRGDIDVRVNPPVINSRYGDPEVESWNFYANAGLPLNETWGLYGWAGYQTREGASAANPRALAGSTLAAATALQAIYPTGFLPLIGADIEDVTAAVGLKGEVAGFNVDVNVVWGRNEINYSGLNTGNATYGALSPTTFDDGGMSYDQLVLGIDVARRVDVGFFEPLNVAFG